MFAIVNDKLLEKLSDRELKVFCAINILIFSNPYITIQEICKKTGKSRRQVIEIVKELEKKGVIKRKKRKKTIYEINIELKFNFDIEGITVRDKKIINKIVENNNLNEEQVNKIIEYMKKRKVNDYVKYFAYLANNYDKVFNKQNDKVSDRVVVNEEDFQGFQAFLNKNKIKFNVLPIKYKVVYPNRIIGEWEFTGTGIKNLYKKYKNENLRKSL
ncbi:MAG: winged helix-turn-helix transcriptional regulator [Candidatus Omnitrophica bacterium]|nr:winged helix-turn-helix transcriptional regulator [Candidatus Omnitrophota bacterium]